MNRRHLLFKHLPALANAAALAALLPRRGLAQPTAAKTIFIVVPFPPGGASDALARQVAPHLSQAMGQSVVVENITGASGTLAAHKMLAAEPDGTTLMVVSSSETIMPPLLLNSARFQAEDFSLLVQPLVAPLALVGRARLAPATLDALLAHGRDPANRPLSYGSFGTGTIPHLAATHFEQLTGLNLLHVPYRGGAPLITDLLGEQIDLSFFPFAGNMLQLAEAGRVKIFGVAGASRLPHLAKHALLGDHPQLEGFVHSAWNSFAVSHRVPELMAERLSNALNTILHRPDIAAFALKMGSVVPERASLAQVAKFYRAETLRLRALARSIDLQAQ
jgi:tripartite-type tricarboxylate transporter receptor subunit TctC